jgi:hypothetical protein
VKIFRKWFGIVTDVNPYRPSQIESDTHFGVDDAADDRAPNRFYFIWALVFAINCIAPVLFAINMTRDFGRLGVGIAVFMFLVMGWYFGRLHSRNAKRLVTGAIIVALTQFFPILQFISGFIAFSITEELGGVEKLDDEDFGFGEISSFFGGFVCTALTGGTLIGVAIVIGWVVVALISDPMQLRLRRIAPGSNRSLLG